jgi:hypothetical protein
MGLSISPVVSIVITALVGVLGALFGLTEKKLPALSGASASRLGAFAIAALVVTPAAIWIRTHELLSPSIQEQIDTLQKMKAAGDQEQYEMLSYIRYGFRPSAPGEKNTGGHSSPVMSPSALYSTHPTFCDQLVTLKVTHQPVSEYEALFEGAGKELSKIGNQISKMPVDQQKAAFESAVLFVCAK